MPFASFGLVALANTMKQMLNGTGGSQVWLGVVFGLVFSGIGFGLLSLAIFGGRFLKRQQRLQTEHPAEPWLWREDWAQGRVKSNTRTGMIGAWVFAAFWNAVSMPALILVPRQAAKNPAAYLGLLFPAVGVFLLIRAIRLTWAYLEFGQTYFEISPVPGVVGGDLKGMIQARFPHSPDHGIKLRLSCVHRVISGSGNTQSTSENIAWRDEASLSSGQLYPGPAGTSIPVHFRIPWDAQPTETRSPRDAVEWVLEALADVPGVDYHDIFVVPVFRTAQTPSQPEPESAFAVQAAPRPDAMAVEVRQNGTGTEFYFPAARNKGFAAMTTVFCLIFGLVTFFLVHVHATFFFLVFGGFFLLLLFITAQMWLGTTRVIIDGGVLKLQAGLLGGGKVRQVPCSEIASIGDKIAAQEGGATGTPFYDIELALRDGQKLTLGRTLRSKQETEWLVEQMQRLTGLQTKTMAAGVS